MNVDTVETVSSQTASTDLDFKAVVNGWERYGENCWSVNDLNQITCDHKEDAWGNSAILCNGDHATADASVDISFNQSAAGTLHNGVFFNVIQDPKSPNVLSGYFISLSQHETAAAYKNQRVLWRFENWYAGDNSWGSYSGVLTWCNAGKGEKWDFWRVPGATNSVNFKGYSSKVTCLASWTNDGTDIDYDIHAENGRISVSTRQGSTVKKVADVKDTFGEPFKYGTYGFYGANCEQTAPFAISNLTYSYTQTSVKSFGDIVYEPTWTEGALHMLINMDGAADRTMLGGDGGVESSTRLLLKSSGGQGRFRPHRPKVSFPPFPIGQRQSPSPAQRAPLAGDAAEILERDYGIDAGEVLSMNVDTVETVTGGIDAQSPDFSAAVNKWEKYGQETFSAALGNSNGEILVDSRGEKVTSLPEGDAPTTETYRLMKYPETGINSEGTLIKEYPAGSASGDQIREECGLGGVIFSDVSVTDPRALEEGNDWRWIYRGESATIGGKTYNNYDPNYGWWGTALLNPDEYDAQNISASFHVVQGGSLNEGFCFNVTQNEGITYNPARGDGQVVSNKKVHPITGYFFNVSHHGNSTQHRLFKVENWRLDNSFSFPNAAGVVKASMNSMIWCSPNGFWSTPGQTNVSELGEKVTCLATWTDDGKGIDYDVDYRDGRIQIWNTDNDDKKKVADIQGAYDEASNTTTYTDNMSETQLYSVPGDDLLTHGTYGFWGNNCEQKGQAQISDLNVAIEKVFIKSFGDIVYEPTWTDGALHMLINMDGAKDRTMLGRDGGVESSTRLLLMAAEGRQERRRRNSPAPFIGPRSFFFQPRNAPAPRRRPAHSRPGCPSPGARRRYWRGTTA